ncbi:MAG: hypothetical protein M3Q58_00170 [Bacteroidota bacterium]|nr:hypothetical protein [Bacteroidota bacterium]
MKTFKNILLFIVLSGLSVNTFAQFTGGGSGDDNRQGGQKTVTKEKNSGLKNLDVFRKSNTYLRLGFSKPVGNFGSKPSSNVSSAKKIYDGKAGVGAKTGFTIEGGFISYFDEIPLAEQYKAGLDISFAYSHNTQDWSHWKNGWEDADYIPFLFFEAKIGPTFSYNVIGDLVVDGYFKLCPVLSYGGQVELYDQDDFGNSSYYTLSGNGGVGIKKALGFNAKYNNMILGLEMNLGRINYNVSEEIDVYSSNNMDSYSDTNYFDGKTPTGTLRFTFGLAF